MSLGLTIGLPIRPTGRPLLGDADGPEDDDQELTTEKPDDEGAKE